MSCLVDTSVLARLANSADAYHGAARGSVVRLHRRGETLHVCAQNLIEFRSVATRPKGANGLGMVASEAEAISAAFETSFALLPDTPEIFWLWKAAVQVQNVVGKQVHDARLVAVCHAHQVTQLLTFNTQHFTRFAAYGPGLRVIDAGLEE